MGHESIETTRIYLRKTANEQQEIVDYLDTKSDEINTIISEKKNQIETLEQYKKSLIYEYVTGKKQVKENA